MTILSARGFPGPSSSLSHVVVEGREPEGSRVRVVLEVTGRERTRTVDVRQDGTWTARFSAAQTSLEGFACGALVAVRAQDPDAPSGPAEWTGCLECSGPAGGATDGAEGGSGPDSGGDLEDGGEPGGPEDGGDGNRGDGLEDDDTDRPVLIVRGNREQRAEAPVTILVSPGDADGSGPDAVGASERQSDRDGGRGSVATARRPRRSGRPSERREPEPRDDRRDRSESSDPQPRRSSDRPRGRSRDEDRRRRGAAQGSDAPRGRREREGDDRPHDGRPRGRDDRGEPRRDRYRDEDDRAGHRDGGPRDDRRPRGRDDDRDDGRRRDDDGRGQGDEPLRDRYREDDDQRQPDRDGGRDRRPRGRGDDRDDRDDRDDQKTPMWLGGLLASVLAGLVVSLAAQGYPFIVAGAAAAAVGVSALFVAGQGGRSWAVWGLVGAGLGAGVTAALLPFLEIVQMDVYLLSAGVAAVGVAGAAGALLVFGDSDEDEDEDRDES